MSTVDVTAAVAPSRPERYNASCIVDRHVDAGRAGKAAFVASDATLTYGELRAQVNRAGHVLRSLGVGREQRVLLVLDDTTAFPTLFLGAMRIGAVPVPVSPLDRDENFRHYVEDSYAQVVCTDAGSLERLRGVLRGLDVRFVVRGATGDDVAELDAGLAAQDDELTPADTHRDDMAFRLYSSGRPASRRAWCTCTTTSRSRARTSPAGPRDHRRRRDVLDDEALPRLRAGQRALVPALVALPPQTFTRFQERFGVEIVDGIGSTEMLHIFCSNRPGAVVPGTTGFPVPGYELRIVDEAGGVIDGPGVGGLEARGDSCAAFYWHQHEKTKSAMRGDWFATGDRYERRADAAYVYVGRMDDMLKVGGLWVSPMDMEHVLLDHPRVLGVGVVGITVDDASRIAAYVECDPEAGAPDDALAEELRTWCKERLRRYEYPHVVTFVDALPRTLTGKVQRFRLREPAAARGA